MLVSGLCVITMEEKLDKLLYEKQEIENGAKYIAGIDEVGRGPLAGPVVCSDVILPLDDIIEGIDDSKKLSKKKREQKEIIVRLQFACIICNLDNTCINNYSSAIYINRNNNRKYFI